MSEEINFYGSNYVNDKEFVRRIVWLSNKFPNNKLKFSYFYHSESAVKTELNRLNIPYKIEHGSRYDSYAEDVWDYMIFLNFDADATLTFTTELSSIKIPNVIIGTSKIDYTDCNILWSVLTRSSNTAITHEPKKLLREIYDSIFHHTNPTNITLHVYEDRYQRYGDQYQIFEILV